MQQPREIVLQILYDIEVNKAYLNISFQNHMEKAGLFGRDVAFVKELVYGSVKQQLALDASISRMSSVKLRKLAPYVLCLLRLGLYQIFYMDKVPQSAAVNETVSLAGKYAGRSRGFVNAILRRATREGLTLPEGESREALSVRYSHPAPLVEWMCNTFGQAKAITILEANQETPPLCLRTNTLKTTRDALLAALHQAGVAAKAGSLNDVAVLVEGANIQGLAAYGEGLFTIQDQSAQLAAIALSPEPGQFVIDFCAAPGGKTTHLAELMENQGEILALDVYEKRLRSVTESAKRLGHSIITTRAADGTKFTTERKADKILVDAPCSGLGVIRRRPDLKYKPELTDFEGLEAVQLAILHQAAEALRGGGELVYSTCTINPGENEGVVKRFLESHSDFSLQPVLSPHLSDAAAQTLQTGMGTLYPNQEQGDGFFIAKLKKELS
ncbi:MAG: 16S rRNA (cytosine(967)-C(5))-methyltransferase RsmB [Ruminococcaceae bacterium]|nr:16S rRNA (cytosine(967)-C(5))-methyltransferase RsmB [Oscillospiraceae bacterium]